MQPWLSNNIGKVHLNPDPPNGIDGQCVNAASSYSMAIGGPELMGPTAYSIYQNFRSPFFQVISGHSVQAGDICFVTPNNSAEGTGSAGHVYIAVSVSGTTIKSVDADYNGHPELTNQVHNTNNVVGVFRPQGGNVADQNAARIQDLQKIGFTFEGISPDSGFDYSGWVGQPLQKVLDDWWGYQNTGIYLSKVTAALEGNAPPDATQLKPGFYKV